MAQYDKSSSLLAIIALLVIYIVHIHLSERSVSVAPYSPSTRGKASTGSAQLNGNAPSRILLITMESEETTYDILSLANKHAYANKHGYDLQVDFEGPGAWHKLNMIENAINKGKYDWIWWMDFDTLFTNNTIKITDIIDETLQKHQNPSSVSMMLTADCWPMNTGSMIYRGDPEILEFLNLVRKCGKAIPSHSEQDCIRDVVGVNDDPKEHPVVSPKWSKRFTYVPQYRINAFPEEIACYDKDSRAWQKGDFLIHFPGAWAHLKMKDPTGYLMRKYRSEVI